MAAGTGDDPSLQPSDWLTGATHNLRQLEYHLRPVPSVGGWTAPSRAHDMRLGFRDGEVTIATRRTAAGDAARTLGVRLVSLGRGDRFATIGPVVDERVDEGRLTWRRDGGLTEHYSSDATGVTARVILEHRADGVADEPLVVSAQVASTGSLFPTSDGRGVTWRGGGGDGARMNGLRVIDASGNVVTACFDVTADGLAIVIDDVGARYPLQVAYLITGPVWSYESGQAGARLGLSVSTAGDVNGDGYSDVIVGVPLWDGSSGAYEGAAFLFCGTPSGLMTTPAWSYESGQADATLGDSVSTAGDVDGDGYSDVIIGASRWDGAAGANDGAAYLFYGSASGLATTPDWSYESGQIMALFGASVASAGDVDGDGYADVIVGAMYWDGAVGGDEGAAFLFRGSAAGLTVAPTWSYASGQVDALLGQSVATAGDVDGDGYSDVIVGAAWWDGAAGAEEGATFVFHGSASGLATTPAWSYESGQSNPGFGTGLGQTVATAGDVNGDGYSDVIVGARTWSGAVAFREGAAFVFHGSSAGLAVTPSWSYESGQANANFGSAASTAGDVDGDGYADVIVGALSWDGAMPNGGAAFVFRGSASGLSTTPVWSHGGG